MKQVLIGLAFFSLVAMGFVAKFPSGRMAEVEQKTGIYVFYKGQKPVDAYDFVGAIETGSFIKNWKPEYLVPLLIKKCKEKYPNADGIMFTEENNWKAEAIKFK